MDSNKDKSRKALSDGQPPLPHELDWERMEAGILQKMEELESEKPPRRPGFFVKIATAVVLLAILLLLVKYCGQPKGGFAFENAAAPQKQPVEATDGPTVQQPSNFAEAPPSQKTEEQAPRPTSKNLGQATAKNGSSPNNPSLKTAAITTTAIITQTSSLKPTGKPAARRIDAPTATTGQPKQALDSGVETAAPALPNTVPVGTTSELKAPAMPSTEAKIGRQSPMAADLLPSRTFFVVGEKTTPMLPEIPVAASEKSPSRKDKSRIFLLGGTSVWGMGYGSNKPERHAFENTTVSFHAGLSYARTLKNNFTLNFGLQMLQLESRFELNQDLNNYKITLIDTILEFRVNTLTGETQTVRGDVELNAPAKRMVRHYNTVRLYQIPFAVGRTWSSEKWQSDVMLGGAVSVFSENSGRTLYQGEILDYDGTSSSLVSTQGKLQAMLTGRLTYLLTKNIGITTGIQFQKSLNNWSREPNIQMRPNSLNLELGLKYSL